MKQTLPEMFLVYCNEFLTVARFASYYAMPEREAHKILLKGRALHESQFGPIV